jgi:hypothetical protein
VFCVGNLAKVISGISMGQNMGMKERNWVLPGRNQRKWEEINMLCTTLHFHMIYN